MNELTINVTAISSLKEMKVIIRSELESLVDGFVALGYYLKKTRDTEMYKEDGYENIFDFAKKEFNLGRSSVYTYMAINDNYSIDGNSPELDEEFRGYGSSKLAEMLTMTDEQIKDITPDATIKDIREYKKITSENESPDVWTNSLNTEGKADFNTSENSLFDFIKYHFKNEGRNVFNKVISIILSDAADKESCIMYAIAPSKFKLVKMAGGTTALLNADNITILKIGQAKEFYSYRDLIIAIECIYHPSEDKTAAEIFREFYNEDLEQIKVPVKITEAKEEKKEKKPLNTESKKKSEEVINEDDPEDEDDELPGQMEINDYPEYIPEVETVEGEVVQEEEVIIEDKELLPAAEVNLSEKDSIIILANKLQNVINAREEYIKQVKEYKELSLQSGVTEEAINYILKEIEEGCNEQSNSDRQAC